MPVFAGDGHDHGEASASATGPAAPRFASASDVFELVGVVEGKRLALYLSRYGDSSPVKDARLEIEDGLAQGEIMDALLDGKGRLWVATESAGVSRVGKDDRVVQFNVRSGILTSVHSFAESSLGPRRRLSDGVKTAISGSGFSRRWHRA